MRARYTEAGEQTSWLRNVMQTILKQGSGELSWELKRKVEAIRLI